MSVVTGLSRKLIIAGAALVATTAGAYAADMPGDYPPISQPLPAEERPFENIEYSSGWYLRGDVGYRFQRSGESTSLDTTQVPAPGSGEVNNAFVGGLGFGFKQDWLRLDATADYGLPAKYSAPVAGGGEIAGHISSFTVMGNAYVDLGTWYGFTPYVGGGLGAANLHFGEYEYANATGAMPSTASVKKRWNFAWAAMAGVSYNIAHNLLLDVGYRYIDLGDVSGGPDGNLSIKSLTGNEIRVGIRYILD